MWITTQNHRSSELVFFFSPFQSRVLTDLHPQLLKTCENPHSKKNLRNCFPVFASPWMQLGFFGVSAVFDMENGGEVLRAR